MTRGCGAPFAAWTRRAWWPRRSRSPHPRRRTRRPSCRPAVSRRRNRTASAPPGDLGEERLAARLAAEELAHHVALLHLPALREHVLAEARADLRVEHVLREG